MHIKEISIKNINYKNSKYIIHKNTLSETDSIYTSNLKSQGILSPILVKEIKKNDYELIDGLKRLKFAINENLETLHATILPFTFQDIEILKILIINTKKENSLNTILNLKFIDTALNKLNLDKKQIISDIFPMLNINFHKDIFNQISKINTMQQEVIEFAEEKNLSFKQCLNLSNTNQNVLKLVFDWSTYIHLSMSNILELSEMINDICIENDLNLEYFSNNEDIQETLISENNPNQKTKNLTNYIRKLRFPILTQTHQNINSITDKLKIPKNIRLIWDHSLENKEIKLNLSIKNTQDIKNLSNFLSEENNQNLLNQVLEYL